MARVVQTPDNRCMPLEEWPFADREAWLAALQPTGLFGAESVAAGWAEGGRAMVISGYGRWLTWLAKTGRLGSDTVPADRATRETVGAYAAALATVNASMTVQSRINQLGRAMRVLAPDQDWGWCSALPVACVPWQNLSGTSVGGCRPPAHWLSSASA